MITLLIIAGSLFALCTAAAGLIASAQNSADAGEAIMGQALGTDIGA